MLCVVLSICAGCARPLPPDKSHYAGEWQGEGMELRIESDGRVAYSRRTGSTTVSVDGPIKEFVGDDFVVGVAFFTTTFAVSEPPHGEGGAWVMVVDGVRLQRY